jgi:hypothetical protein
MATHPTSEQAVNRPGIGVDAAGAPVVDPTKNVEDLVKAGEQRQADLREADQRFLDAQLKSMSEMQTFARQADMKLNSFAREASDKMQTALRAAETIRIDQLAQNRQEYQNTIRDMLAESVRTTSTLVSTQLVQIQATFDTRVSKLEAFQFTQAGRSSVADPALSDALLQLANGQKLARDRSDDAMAKMTVALQAMQTSQNTSGGNTVGRSDAIAVVRANIGMIISIGVALLFLLSYLRGVPIHQ